MMASVGTRSGPLRPTFIDSLHPAVRLGAAVLGALGSLAVDPPTLLLSLVLLCALLALTGLGAVRQAAALRPWLPAALLVMAVHAFSSTEYAPLWHPSRGGVLAGAVALLRVTGTLGWLALYARTSGLEESLRAVRWWTVPLGRLGAPTGQLGLVVAVALGTVPGVLAEGRRVETALRMRRAGSPDPGRSPRRPWRRLGDRLRVVVPLVESVVRRAENLTLALRARTPLPVREHDRPPAAQLILLLAWLAALLAWVRTAPLAPGDWGLR